MPGLYFHLGQVHELLRRDYDAQACYEAAVRLQPEAAEMQRRLGDLLVIKRNSGAEFRCQSICSRGGRPRGRGSLTMPRRWEMTSTQSSAP